jgi:glycosyltransferase involved in cell wall biosynthesis
MIRVAFVDQIGRAPGGAEQTLAAFLRHAPTDIEPIVVLFEDGGFADRVRALGVPVEIITIPYSIGSATRERPQLSAAFQIPPVAFALARTLRRRSVELVYTNTMKAHFVGAPAARLAGIPCIMHFHDIVAGVGLRALRSVAKFGTRERIACSQAVADAIGLGKTTVIYAPIELEDYAALPDREDARRGLGFLDATPVVAIIGRINRWKGHERFLRIAARVSAEVPSRFAIVGAPVFRDADFVPELHKLVDELELTSCVSFIPWVDDVRTVYAAIDVNVNCSFREPFGRTSVEAAAAGVPTICFDDSGAAETIVHGVTGLVVPAGDERSFAEAIIHYLRDAARRRANGTAARRASFRFDAKLIAAETADVIRRVAA